MHRVVKKRRTRKQVNESQKGSMKKVLKDKLKNVFFKVKVVDELFPPLLVTSHLKVLGQKL
jgi:hypothetical protein